ncbi:DotU family type IV/VI secretion system protein [Glaciimonas immobilis]|uniref:Type VI secretion system protein ImpK n=1 Tax=Glaciimonas immobilis TaxID=728004 RepID=A0A840RNA2_9BURK|nr:DotU/TssL family secretion system protein [Glaciimonas immobilis]KAF3998067.1 DotU family type IV/VI secretion system protein [Glaciimonas immobilis]MBB5199243.1 type VI secretion system protein ImpK [Glaciimonas immobilis]
MISSHSRQSLRTMLLDTGLLLALLSQQAEILSIEMWRLRLFGMVEQLRTRMREAGYDQVSIDEASYAQCALLDEIALRYLPDRERCEWQSESLEMHFFGTSEAGTLIFDRINALLLMDTPQLGRIALYDYVLGLGYGGRYPDRADPERQRLVAGLIRSTETIVSPELAQSCVHRPSLSAKTISLLRWTAVGATLSVSFWCLLACQANFTIDKLSNFPTELSSISKEG